MTYRIAFPALALLVAGGCSGSDATSPMSQIRSPSANTAASSLAAVAPGKDAGVREADTYNDRAISQRSGALHVTKECSAYNGLAGDFCTITSSNLEEIKVGSNVFYDQAAGIPAGLLDSNVVLDAGNGDRALGRCTVDMTTHLGLCTFSDGIGELAGFHARVDVDCRSGCRWDGTYGFRRERDRDR
jgi:hypothetical protein